MVLKIRLRQQGNRNRRQFRLVLADARSPRDGKYIEKLGHYDPQAGKEGASLREERIRELIEHGAQPSENAEKMMAHCSPNLKQFFVSRKK